jgi:DNA-binding IclR family transcriptional regulator
MKKRERFSPAKVAMLHKLFERGKSPSEVIEKTGLNRSSVYRYYGLWKTESYVAKIGPDKPSMDWAAIGDALMQLGRVLSGNHRV